ncbi:hypothetical protein Godav_024825 [Gossypium davidsonii]|uniref:Nucleotide-diphospho-sugar transferase domain-containing protein n=1 Tax=Gossypium davidsonii TaxID=34287 RepID=A0A7J8TI77_GOSDV|nr:hypothetical protein [Gossypium davidsonii]
MDVMWLRNPFPKINAKEGVDQEISGDSFTDDPQSEHNLANASFYYVRSNNKTISLFNTGYSLKDKPAGKKEQDVLQDLMHGGLFGQLNLKDVTTVTSKFRDLSAVLCDWKKTKR